MDETRELSPAQAVAVVYERAIIMLQRAQDRWSEDRNAALGDVRHAQEIILELRRAVKGNGELQENLRSFYTKIYDGLEAACANPKDASFVASATMLMRRLADAWNEALRKRGDQWGRVDTAEK